MKILMCGDAEIWTPYVEIEVPMLKKMMINCYKRNLFLGFLCKSKLIK